MSKEFESIDILKLLPQQPPFVMVDKLLHFDPQVTTTGLRIEKDNIFVENGVFTPSGLIENIAQTCAARMGYINQFIYKENVKLGFIGSVRNLEIARCPKAGEELTTSIKIMEEVFQMTLVEAEVKVGDETIVTSEMKIALSDIDSNAD
ncbi:MAG: pseudouridylate synthase [Bacteroidaceae bacterium]|nr:pseudouridylate synthase [Bacteroidaceae bacterium]